MARGWLIYTLDDGTNTSMKATSVTATYNGQTLTTFPQRRKKDFGPNRLFSKYLTTHCITLVLPEINNKNNP